MADGVVCTMLVLLKEKPSGGMLTSKKPVPTEPPSRPPPQGRVVAPAPLHGPMRAVGISRRPWVSLTA